MEVVNQFYAGALLHLYRIWKQGKTIGDSGFVIRGQRGIISKKEIKITKTTTTLLKKKVKINEMKGFVHIENWAFKEIILP